MGNCRYNKKDKSFKGNDDGKRQKRDHKEGL